VGGVALLDIKDSTESTPAELAGTKGNFMLRSYLTMIELSRKQGSFQWWCPSFDRVTQAIDRATACFPKLHTTVYISIFIMVAAFLQVVVLFPEGSLVDFPQYATMGPVLASGCWVATTSAALSLVFLFRAATRDPGYLPKKSVRKEGALGSADTNRPAICSGNWDLLCVKCKILKPVRTKHCTVCDRCVSLYDHHSPWIGNCVGSRNRKDMILFLVLLTVAITAGALVASHRMWALGQMELGMTHAPALLMWLVVDSVLLVFVGTLAITKCIEVASNLTAFEMANFHTEACGYLKDNSSKFHNPYDKGVVSNVTECLLQSPKFDEIIFSRQICLKS
ncbi:hypothetical protein CYMTET_29956, partial [Cymbomonas tetramitiformis]